MLQLNVGLIENCIIILLQAFKDYCQSMNEKYRRIFVKTSKEKSITDVGYIAFRRKSQDETELKTFDLKNLLKPVAPLYESFQSYQFIMAFIEDQGIQSSLVNYLEAFDDLESGYERLKAIGNLKNNRLLLNNFI